MFMSAVANFPLRFSEILGQSRAQKVLRRLWDSSRLAHGYLFRGPRGVGKRSCAVIFAAHLLCPQPHADGGCGQCPTCRKLASANHPDLCFVRPEAGSIKIKQVRELRRDLEYPPFEAPFRITIIEDINTMTTEAANSLLKTLEEPPSDNVLILTATDESEVWPTIVSRCQSINFYLLSVAQTTAVLHRLAPETDEDGRREAALFAEGSPGTALRILEHDMIALYQRVTAAVEAGIESTGHAELELLEAAAAMAALKDEVEMFLGMLRTWIYEKMAQGGSRALAGSRVQLDAVDEAVGQLRRHCNRALVCEVLLFNLQRSMQRVVS
jgi:DNA polymerase-3 subunit delta'